jgi:hypothetical protein
LPSTWQIIAQPADVSTTVAPTGALQAVTKVLCKRCKSVGCGGQVDRLAVLGRRRCASLMSLRPRADRRTGSCQACVTQLLDRMAGISLQENWVATNYSPCTCTPSRAADGEAECALGTRQRDRTGEMSCLSWLWKHAMNLRTRTWLEGFAGLTSQVAMTRFASPHGSGPCRNLIAMGRATTSDVGELVHSIRSLVRDAL